MGGEGTVEAEFHHERLGVGELCLAASVKRLRHKEVLTENTLNDLQVLVWIISLAESLLPCHLIGSIDSSMRSTKSTPSIGVDWSLSTVQPLLFLLGALLEEDLAKHIFFLFVRVIVLDVVVVGLVEHAVRVVVAVRILVANTSGLSYAGVRVHAVQATHPILQLCSIVLTGDEQDALVEATDHRDLGWSLLLLL